MKQIILIACPGTCQTDDDENKKFLATNYKNDGQLMFKSMQICVYNFFFTAKFNHQINFPYQNKYLKRKFIFKAEQRVRLSNFAWKKKLMTKK